MTLLDEISPPRFDVVVDLVYGHDDNFMGQSIYANPRCFLHADAAACLELAVGYAAEQGLRLKVTDAFRPSEAQWVHCGTIRPIPIMSPTHAVARPTAEGAAVDVTLLDAQGSEFDMGGPVDDLTANGHHDAVGITPGQRANRFLLLGIMTAAGFDWYVNEWWHYQLFAPRRYPVLSDRAAGTDMMA